MKRKTLITIIISMLGLLLVLTIFINYNKESTYKTEEQINNEKEYENAAFYAYQFIKEKLKSPSTAKFPSTQFAEITKEGNLYIVKSYVDSQNGFGATIRTKFEASIKYNEDDSVSLTSYNFFDN